MSTKALVRQSTEVLEGLTVYRPNLNTYCELEEKLGSVDVLDNLNKLSDIRMVIYILANKKVYDSEDGSVPEVIGIKAVGNMIDIDDLIGTCSNLRDFLQETVSDSKNSQGSSEA